MSFYSGDYKKTIPVELVRLICSYLNARDVLSLSAVNTFWRNASNSDMIWKKFCEKDFGVDPNEKPIIERACFVKPAFRILTNDCPNLNHICDWRIRYAQEIHVVNNWKSKRFHFEKFPTNLLGPSYSNFNYYVFGNLVITRCNGLLLNSNPDSDSDSDIVSESSIDDDSVDNDIFDVLHFLNFVGFMADRNLLADSDNDCSENDANIDNDNDANIDNDNDANIDNDNDFNDDDSENNGDSDNDYDLLQVFCFTDKGLILSDRIMIPITEPLPPFIRPLKNGFIVIRVPFIYYYVINGNKVELKIRSHIRKALLPDAQILMEESTLKKYQYENYFYYFNDRFFVAFKSRPKQYTSIFVWDFKELNTFYLDFKDQNITICPRHVYIAKGVSPIFYMANNNNQVNILNLMQYPVITEKVLIPENFNSSTFFDTVDDSLAIIMNTKITFVKSYGEIKTVECSVIDDARFIQIRRSRSFICVFSRENIILMDEDLVIKHYVSTGLNGFCVKNITADLILLEKAVWDLETTKPISYVPYIDDFLHYKSNSNQVVLNPDRLKVYHFW